jgi:hypothetical protein
LEVAASFISPQADIDRQIQEDYARMSLDEGKLVTPENYCIKKEISA